MDKTKAPPHLTAEPRLTNAQLPPHKRVPFTLSNLMHHRHYGAVRELLSAIAFAAAALVVAYMWIGAADPSMP